MAFLKVIVGSVPGQIIELTEDKTLIGRHPDSHIVLDNAAVSRHHAQILVSHGRYYLEDLRSRNGTYLNDSPIVGRKELKQLDRIDICEIVLEFCLEFPNSVLEPDFEVGPTDDSSEASSTRIGMQIPPPEENEELESSSILSSIDASDGSRHNQYRLDVNSEAKLKAILSISRALNRVLNVDEALEKTMEQLFEIFPQADEGFAMLIDPVSNRPVIRSVRNRDPKRSGEVSQTVIEFVLREKTAILTEDASSDHRFRASESIAGAQLRSLVCLPVLNGEGEPLGLIQLAAYSLLNSFSKDDLDLLTAVAGQVGLAIENAQLHQQMIAQRDLRRDLDYAHQIQRSFLPSKRPELEHYQFFDYYEAAQSIGGDYFDYIPLPRHRWAFTIADVAGKGIPAALLMARLYSAARYHLLTTDNMARAIEGLNEELATGGVGHRFVTCVLAVVNPETKKIKISNAGHLPPIIKRADGSVQTLSREDSGLPLGLEPGGRYRQVELTLKPGESLLLYTDGTTEAANDDEELFGMERLKKSVAKASPEAESLIHQVLNDIDAFCNTDAQRDDVCLVALHRRPDQT